MLKDEYLRCRSSLKNGGIEAADFEARCLVEKVTGYDRTKQIINAAEPLTGEQIQLLNSLTEKRLSHYPLQYLLGEWSFMGFPLSVGEGVLIPRDDTEVCVESALDYLKDKPDARAVDLCSGSGAIAIAIEKLAKAEVTAVELSRKTFKFLKENIIKNNSRIQAVRGDIMTCHSLFDDGCFDLIISNPPYIKTDDLAALQPEVRFEPETALNGGGSGLIFYEAIIECWSQKLRNGGALVFELGEGQAETVAQMMKNRGFKDIRTRRDFGGCERAISGIFSDS